MGSAGISDVSDKGFGVSSPRRAIRIDTEKKKNDRARPGPLSSTSITLTAAAILGALLFVAQDSVRTVTEMQERTSLAAALAAAEIAPRDLDAPRMGQPSLPDALSENAVLIVTAGDGEVLASTADDITPGSTFDPELDTSGYLSAEAPIAGDLGHVTIAVGHGDIAADVIQRGGLVLGSALLFALVIVRRGARRAVPQPETKNELVTAIDAAPYGLARWDDKGRLVGANAAFARLLRLPPAEMTEGIDYSWISRRISGQITTRPTVDAEHHRLIEVERPDGSVVVLDERPCPSGGFISTVNDITDRKAADRMLAAAREEQRQLARRYHEEKIRAEAASRAKTSFLAHLSHDIRTPLNHIIGFADLMRMETCGPLGDSKYHAYLGDIKKAGEKLLFSFGELLEFAELEGGQRQLAAEPVSVADLLVKTASRFSTPAAKAGIRLHTADIAPGTIKGDRAHLDRMLANLVENAIRFTPRGGEIRLAAWAAEDGVVLEITDTGAGMGEEQLSRLSQPFALSDAAFAKEYEGIGLGIAIARAIAEASGGRLAIDSLENVGTTIAISLPLESAQPHPETFTPAQAA